MSKPVVSSDFYLTNVSTLAAGGIGYAAGNILTLNGGTFTTSAQITVTTVATNVITGFTVSRGGVYSIIPTAPFTFTGGTGTGAAINAVFASATPGFTPLLIYGSNTAGAQPAAGSLANRELFVDTATPSLYVGGTMGAVVKLTGTLAPQASNNVSITGGTISVTANPTTGLQVATKQYVDLFPGTVTNVSFGSPASSAFSVATPSTTPVISLANVGVTPTGVFLRGDGTWVAPSSIVNTGGWSIAQVATKLNFSYNGVLVASLGSNGLFTSANNIVAFSTP